MTRRRYIENIIIGTLLECGEDYWQDCKCCITEDMMQDEVNRRIYHLIADMHSKGFVETTPLDIYNEYGFMVEDIIADICERSMEYSFLHLKTDYNERRYIASLITGERYKRTDVQFSEYVNQFLRFVYEAK